MDKSHDMVLILITDSMATPKTKVQLGPVQETLLIPLLGRARESERSKPLIRDDKAAEIVNALDYDFSKWEKDPSLFGACLRTRFYDGEVSAFLEAHPGGTVVEIGAGLNTRFERLDNGRAHFIELDLPDSMALRRQFFQDAPRRKMIAASVLDEDWHAAVKASPGPYCFVSEAVIIYLDNDAVEGLLARLAQTFPGAWLITDTTAKEMVNNQHRHTAMNKLPKASWFRWRCDDPKDLEALGMRLERSYTMAEHPKEWLPMMPGKFRFVARYLPWLMHLLNRPYRINRFIFED